MPTDGYEKKVEAQVKEKPFGCEPQKEVNEKPLGSKPVDAQNPHADPIIDDGMCCQRVPMESFLFFAYRRVGN